jgi:hypothetical protein
LLLVGIPLSNLLPVSVIGQPGKTTVDRARPQCATTHRAASYFKATTVAAVSVSWEPADEANCPTDQPISACDIAPGQQNFTISIDLVQIA